VQRGLVVLVHLDRREVEVRDVLPREPYLAAEPFPSFVQAILPGVAILGGMQDGTAIYSIGDVDGRDARRKGPCEEAERVRRTRNFVRLGRSLAYDET
jgi:hypothetical protein